MLTNGDRWWLTGAWAFIIGCGLAGVVLIQGRGSTKEIPAAETPDPGTGGKHRKIQPQFSCKWPEIIRPVRDPVTPYVGCILPEIILKEIPAPPPTEWILPTAIYSGKIAMDRVTLAWTLEPIKESKTEKLVQRRSPPQAIVIHRQMEDGEFEPLALLDPKATSFEDRTVQSNRSYRYWVQVRGDEGTKFYSVSTVRTIDKDGTGEVEGRVPAWHKVKLKGGDREHAILAVESYNPQKGQWENRRFIVSPGQKIGATGWTVDGLRFEKSTLVAEVTDDRGEKRDLSTKE